MIVMQCNNRQLAAVDSQRQVAITAEASQLSVVRLCNCWQWAAVDSQTKRQVAITAEARQLSVVCLCNFWKWVWLLILTQKLFKILSSLLVNYLASKNKKKMQFRQSTICLLLTAHSWKTCMPLTAKSCRICICLWQLTAVWYACSWKLTVVHKGFKLLKYLFIV